MYLRTRSKVPYQGASLEAHRQYLTCWFSGFLSLAGNLEVYKRSWFKPLLHEEDGQPQRKLSHSKNRLPMNLYNYYGTWQTPKHAFHCTVQWRICLSHLISSYKKRLFKKRLVKQFEWLKRRLVDI